MVTGEELSRSEKAVLGLPNTHTKPKHLELPAVGPARNSRVDIEHKATRNARQKDRGDIKIGRNEHKGQSVKAVTHIGWVGLDCKAE